MYVVEMNQCVNIWRRETGDVNGPNIYGSNVLSLLLFLLNDDDDDDDDVVTLNLNIL